MPFPPKRGPVLVTGAGRGIRRAIARRLVCAEARVMRNDLDEATLLESEAESAHPGEVRHVTDDLTNPWVPERIVKAALAEFDSFDIIVNNAGYSWNNIIRKTTDGQSRPCLRFAWQRPFVFACRLGLYPGCRQEGDSRRPARHAQGSQQHLRSRAQMAALVRSVIRQARPVLSVSPKLQARSGADIT